MANRPSVPNWNTVNLNKPNEYSSEFLVGGSRYANVTDVSTGQRWLYSVGIANNRTLISSTSANGEVTKGPGFDAVSSQYSTIDSRNKSQSEFIIQRVSTAEEKAAIGKGSQYKSRFGNAVGVSTITAANQPAPLIGVSTFIPDISNPIIPVGEIVKYPVSMDDYQDRVVFTAVEIKPRSDFFNSPGGQGNVGGVGVLGNQLGEEQLSAFQITEPEYVQIGGHIALPLQAPIQDQNGVDWGSDTITAVQALLYNTATTMIGNASPGQGDRSNDAGSAIQGQTLQALNTNVGRLQRIFAGEAAGISNILARTDGTVLNPNLELIFQGPQLRSFSFTFKLSARSEDEAKQIKRIIKYFKRHMAVRKDPQRVFIKAPHVFTIMYQKGAVKEVHPSIGKISPTYIKRACALTNMSVDYTPLGTYMTFNDSEGTMAAYTMALQFQEIQPIYDTDYDDKHSIGY